MRKWFLSFLICMSSLSGLAQETVSPSASPAPLRIALFDLKPFAWKENDQTRGFHVDLSRGIGEKIDRPIELRLVPVRRAIEMLRSGEVDIIIMTEQDLLKDVPLHKAFVMETVVSIYTRASKPFIGTLKDFHGNLARLSGGCAGFGDLPHVKWSEIHDFPQALNMLFLDRIDGICGTQALQRLLDQNKEWNDKVKSTPISRKQVWVQALATMDAKLWKQIEKATETLVKDGSVLGWEKQYSKF